MRVLTVSAMIFTFMQQLTSAFEVLYIFALGGTGTTLSLIATIRLILGVLLRIPGGYIADNYGRRRIIGIGSTLISLAYLLYVFAKDWTWIAIGAALISFTNLYGPALEAIRADSVSPNERGRGFTLATNLPKIPAIISPTLGGILIFKATSPFGIDLQNIRLGFLLLCLGTLFSGLIRFFFLKETILPRTTQEKNPKRISLGMFREVYKTNSFLKTEITRLIILNGIFMFSFHFGATFRSAYAVHLKGLTTAHWGLIESISQVCMITLVFIIGDLIDSYGRKKVFIPSVILLGVSTCLFIWSHDFPSFLIAMIMMYTGLMSRMISLQVLIADTIPRRERGRILSSINILGSIGSQGSIIISGLLYDIAPTLPFYVAVIMYTFATVIAIKFLKEPEIRQI